MNEMRSLHAQDLHDACADAAGHAVTAPPGGEGPRTVQNLLGRVMTADLIPRLVASANESRPAPDDALRDRLLRAVLRGDRSEASAIGLQCARQGMAPDVLMQELLAPVADALGRSWEEDRCDFITVTLGMQVLDGVLDEIGAAPQGRMPTGSRRALVAAAPGEQHLFGARMAAEMLFRAGWHVTRVSAPGRAGLLAAASEAPYDLIGISVANANALDRLGDLVAEIRRVSLNRGVRIALGGSAVTRNPVAAGRQGADWIAVDGADGVAKAAAPVARADDED